MKEKIEKINTSIEEKRERMKEKVERYFSSITIPSKSTSTKGSHKAKKGGVPPVSYILYGIAGVSIIGAMTTDCPKLLCLGVAATSAFGGYKLSQNKDVKASPNNESINLMSVKNEITSKVIDSVKKITSEWEEFMELKQKEIQTYISVSTLDDDQKNSMSSKIFIYEVIDINLSDFSQMMNSVTNSSEIREKVDSYKANFLSEIDIAVDKQIAKYKSLC